MSITRSSPVQVAGFSTTFSQAPKLVSTSWSKVSVGPSHVLAIKSNNTLWAWGLNNLGQLGDSTTISRSSPVQIGNPGYTWNDISVGINYSIALRGDNLLFAWGVNTAGILGDLNVPIGATRSSPNQIGASSWTQISAGVSHAAAIRSDRQLFTWGFNNLGQLGIGDFITRSSPVQIGASSWSTVSAGLNFTTAITSDSKLFTWGDNTVGALGYTTPAQPYFSWTNIAGNDDFTIAVRNDGLLFGWGTNAQGQLGLNDTVARSSPTQIGTNSWTIVSVNGLGGSTNETAAAIRSDGTLWTWGYNATGGLGDGTTLNRSSPVQVSGGGSWSAVASGRSHKLAIKADGTLYAWGLNSFGQLGIVNENGLSWRQLSVGMYYTLAIRSDFKLFGWGTNAFGELGVNDTSRRSSPVQVGTVNLSTTSWLQVSAGGGANAPQGGHSLGIDSLGRLYAWGLNNIGQLGLGDVQPRSNPTQITSINESFAVISAYNSASAAISTLYKLYTWGQNSYQEIGDGTTIHRSVPVQIGASSWTSVASGNFSKYAIDSNYNLYTWGRNDVGQLGLGNVVQRSSPTQVTSIVTSWSIVAAGASHAVAIDINQNMYCWGWNGYGQLGNNTNTNRSAPIQMGAGSSWIQAAAGNHQTLMLRSDFTYWGTGYNNDGQLGDLTGRWRSNPVQITSSNVNNRVSWTQLSSARGEGTGDGGGIASDGTLWRWGYNGYGQLGLNNTTANLYSPILVYSSQESRSSPIQIGIGNSWTKVGIGDLTSYAIKSDSTLWSWGNNASGVLGNHELVTVHRSSPVQVGGSTGWTNVFGYGASHVHAIRSFSLFAWGLNTSAQLGINQATVARSSPVQIGTNSWLTLGAYGTGNNTLGITTDGGLWAWGTKSNLLLNEFGNASFTYSWTQISTGISHTAAIRSDGTLWTWGINLSGQLGDNTTTDRNSPSQVYTTVLGEQWNKVSAFGSRTYAIRQDGTMWAWGDNTNFMLGDGASANRSNPVQIVSTNALTSNRGAGSVYFEYTTNDSRIAISNSDLNVSTNPYMFEAWLYPTKLLYNNTWNIIGQSASTANGCFGVFLNNNSGQQFNVQVDAYGVSNNLWYVPEIIPNRWYHLAIVRNAASEIAVFWNGIRATPDGNVTVSATTGYYTDTRNFNANITSIGYAGGPYLWPGYISNLRLIIGRDGPSVYDPRQISITVPTSPVTPRRFLANNKYLVTCQGWPIIDSTGSYVLTTNNVVNATEFSPFTSSQTVGVSFTSISAGQSHALALDSTNKLWGWGSNDYKQLGSIVSWRTIATGASHAVYLRSDGALFGTGANDAGQLGDGTVTTRSSPVQLGALRWNSVTTGSNHNLGILFDGTLWTWGLNSSGQLGTGDSVNRSNPVQIGESGWSSIVAGASHSIALRSDNLMFVWGNSTNGQLGLGDTGTRFSPTMIGASGTYYSVNFNASAATADALNFSSSYLPTSAGTAFTLEFWVYPTKDTSNAIMFINSGNMEFYIDNTNPGQLRFDLPTAVTNVLNSGTARVSLNVWNHIALTRTVGNAYTLYLNGVNVATGSSATAITTLTTFGYKSSSLISSLQGYLSQLRTTSTVVYSNNFTVPTSPLTAISGTLLLTCQSSTLVDNSGNNITITKTGTPLITPTIVPFSGQVITATSWTNIFAGNNRTFATQPDSTLWAWGLNTSGELGVTDTISRSSPVQVSSGLSWTSVATGTSHTVALRTDSTLYAWGGNSAGQLGDDTTVNKSSPTQIGSSSYSSVGATALASRALRIDGRLFVWGSNVSPNNLGLSDTVNRSSPVQLNTLSYTIIPASAGSSTFTTVVDVEGELWGWGENGKGQLGQWQSLIGDTLNRSSPVQIGANALTSNFTKLLGRGIRPIILDNTSSFTQISAGGNHSLAIKSDGTLWSWGDNTVGQTGNSATLAKSWIAVYSSGVNDVHTYAMREDRTLWAWGYNGYGEIGTRDVIDRSSPVQVMADKRWSHVSIGGSYTVGITTDGLLWSWGDNSAGQLGDWTPTARGARRSSPVQVGTSSWNVVSANNSVVMAIKADGTLWGWGRNEQGQLGNGTTTSRSSPTQVSGGGSWLTVTAGLAGSIGIKIDGSLWVWGYDVDGQMGQNSSNTPRSNPVQVMVGQSFISTGSITGYTNYAIRNDYTLWGWGWGGWGQLGINTTANMSSPVQIPVTGSIIQVIGSREDSGGGSRAFFLNNEGVLFTAGHNVNGELGDMTVTNRSNPVQVGSIYGPLGYTTWNSANPINYSFTFVAAYQYGGFAIASGPNVTGLYGWGLGDQTQLGLGIAGGVSARRSSPTQIASSAAVFLPTYVSSPTQVGTSSWSIISAGVSYSAGITTDYRLFTWGDNSRLQLGSISLANAIGSGGNPNSNAGAFIRNTDSALFLWGANDVGQLGDNTTGYASSPVQIGLGNSASAWKKIARAKVLTGGHTLGVKQDGTLWAWGNNNNGQLGTGITINKSSPIQLGTATNWSDVAAGYSHSLAIKTDGSLWGWGLNTSGQVGAIRWTKISSGSSHTLAIRSDGQMFAWGKNDFGQVGDVTNVSRSSPVQIGGGARQPLTGGYSWSEVSAGIDISAAIRGDGTLWTWGRNNNGQLGDLSISDRNSPVLVGGFTSGAGQFMRSWNQVSARDYMVAVRSDGRLFAWGTNAAGVLSQSETTNRSSPVQIGTATDTAYSNFFNGTTASLTTTANANFAFGTDTFTIECWLYSRSIASSQAWYDTRSPDTANAGYGLFVGSSVLNFGTAGTTYITGTTALLANTWYHVAVARESTTVIKMYLNGVQEGPTYTASATQNFTNNAPRIGNGANGFFNGYITNLRVIKGQALYTGNFIPSTTPLTNSTVGSTGAGAAASITGTVSLLTCQSTSVIDNSGNSVALTNTSSLVIPGQGVTPLPMQTFTSVTAGLSYVLAIATTGLLYGWGLNSSGQLGLSDTVIRSSPVQIGTSAWSSIDLGNSHSTAITSDGKLFAWGRNNEGQLGLGDTASRSSPVQVGASSWSLVNAGGSHTSAIRADGVLFVWGLNTSGQLGLNDTVNRSSPVAINGSGVSSGSPSVYFSGSDYFILPSNQSAFTFGTGDFTIESWVYITSLAAARTIYDTVNGADATGTGRFAMQVTTGGVIQIFTLAGTIVTSGGTLMANIWYHISASRTSASLRLFVNGTQVNTTATDNNNYVVGNTNRPVIGINGFDLATSPMLGYISNIRVIKGQGLYTATFTPSTTALTNNTVGSTGAGAAASITGTVSLLTCQSNTLVDNSGNNFTLRIVGTLTILDVSVTTIVSAGENNTILVGTNGSLFNVGNNAAGQIGDSTTVSKSFPQLAANSTLSDTRSSPAQIGTGSWSLIAAGNNYSVGVRTDGSLWSWGDNTNGILGTGDTLLRRSMMQVGTNSWISISSGGSHTVALGSDLTLYAWGLNNAGQLGDNTTINKSSPVQVNTGTVTNWNSISAGASHTLAIDAINNFPYGWGLNGSGQIGDGTLVSKSTPTLVSIGAATNFSYQFNGTTKYLTLPSSSLFAYGSGDYTIECWFYLTAAGGAGGTLGSVYQNIFGGQDASSNGPIIRFGNSGYNYYLQFTTYGPGTTNTRNVNLTQVQALNTWYHVALVKQSGIVYMYLNGVRQTTSSGTSSSFTGTSGYTDPYIPIAANAPSIGALNATGLFNGYISNLRVVKGTALYTTGFYPSTGALTTTSQGATTSQVSLLTAQSSTIVDNSINVLTITNTGTVAASVINPYGPYYSGSFNGTTQYLEIANNASNQMGAGDWTAEAWIYITTHTQLNAVFSKGGSTTDWFLGTRASTGVLYFGIGATDYFNTGSTAGPFVSLNVWHHVALVRSGTTLTSYLDGVSGNGVTANTLTGVTQDFASTGTLRLGRGRDSSPNYLTGYISNARLVKGTAVYTGNFTVPTNILRTTQSAMTNIVALTGTETVLLTLQNATIVDNSSSPSTITNNGTVLITTAYAPFSATAAGANTTWDIVQAGVTSSMGFSNNTLYTWGAPTNGQLADNQTVTTKSAPAAVGGRLYNVPLSLKYSTSPIQIVSLSNKSWSLVATGISHVTAMATDYSLWAWGYNNAGQFGDNTTISKSSPVQVTGITFSFSQLTAAAATLGVRATADKLLYGWGQSDQAGGYALANSIGDFRSNPIQLYSGTTDRPLIPIKLSTVTTSSFTLVQAGSAASVIDSTGRLFTWGTNANGQVGDLTLIVRSSPVQVGGLTTTFVNSPVQVGNSSYSQISAGYSHTLAITSTGQLFAWGKTPANGQSVNRSSPVQIGSNSWLNVSTGNDMSLATDSTQTLYAWGLNTNYQLGSPNFYINQSVTSPVAIGTLALREGHSSSGGASNGGFIKNI